MVKYLQILISIPHKGLFLTHVKQKHPEKPVYPTIRQIQELGLEPQNKIWEVEVCYRSIQNFLLFNTHHLFVKT